MGMPIVKLSVSLAVALVTLAGCADSRRPRDGGYQTVAEPPHRRTELARQLNAEATALLDEGDLPGAQRLLTRALEADVTFGPAHNNLGKVYYHQDNLYLAAWEFQHAARLMPYLPEPKNNLGLVLERVGKLKDAEAHYRQALELEPDNPQLLGNLARALARRGERGEAMRELLTKLVMVETRPAWKAWARERLMLMGGPPPEAPEAPGAEMPEAVSPGAGLPRLPGEADEADLDGGVFEPDATR